MTFMKDVLIYEHKRDKVTIYINECHRGPRITRVFAIRRSDRKSRGYLLGIIKFSPGWRSYVTEFEPKTMWSSSCKKKICEFEDMMTKKWRDKHALHN